MHVIRGINSRYWQECTGFHTCVFVYTGFWPLLDNETNRFLKYVRGFPYFALAGMVTTTIVAIYDITFKLNDYILLAESLTYLIMLLKTVVILLIAIFKMDDIVNIFSSLEAFVPCVIDAKERWIFERFINRTVWYTCITVSVWFLGGVIFTIKPLFEAERRYPLHYNLPLESPLFEICYLGSVLSSIGASLSISIFDSFMVSAYIGFTGFLEILQYKIEHVREFSLAMVVKKMAPRQATGLREILANSGLENVTLADGLESGVNEGQRGERDVRCDLGVSCISSADLGSHRIDIESLQPELVAGQSETTEDAREELDSETTPKTEVDVDKRDLDGEMRCHLGDCVALYDHLWRVVDETQSRANYVLFIDLIFGAVALCLLMFLTFQVPFGSVDMFLWILNLVLLLQELYGYCRTSSNLQEESVQVSDALYFSDWTEASLSYKRSMLIMMSRAVRPMQISTMNFLTFDMEMFRTVVHSAYSYFNVISTMHTKEK